MYVLISLCINRPMSGSLPRIKQHSNLNSKTVLLNIGNLISNGTAINSLDYM